MGQQLDVPPFDLLDQIDRRCREHGAALPKVEEVKAQWTGIGFRIGEAHFVAPLGQIQEILTDPEYTSVPGAKSWIKGISNNRGTLLPIIDLGAYLGMGRTPSSRRSRILVIQFGLLISGLLVHEIKGQRHFLYDQEVKLPPEIPQAFKPYVEGAYSTEEDLWLLFNLRRLAETPEFLQAAA